MNLIVKEDIEYIYKNVGKNLEKFKDSNIFITGCCGFLGYYFLHFFDTYKEKLGIKETIDSFFQHRHGKRRCRWNILLAMLSH